MGDPFFKQFYSVFDVTNRKIGLAISALAPEGSTITGLIPTPTPEPVVPKTTTFLWNIWTEILIGLLVVLIGMIIGLLCYMKHLKRHIERENDNDEASMEEYDARNDRRKPFV